MVDSAAEDKAGLKQRFIAQYNILQQIWAVVAHHWTIPRAQRRMLSPLQAVLVSVEVSVDQPVVAGQELAVVEAMKMQHVIKAPSAGGG